MQTDHSEWFAKQKEDTNMSENLSCAQLAKQLTVEDGLRFNAMQIGKLRAKCCDDSDSINGKIKPSGVVKICRYLDLEIADRQDGKEVEVKCQVLAQSNNNPRIVVCKDLETKKRCLVGVPIKRKHILNKPGKNLPCLRITKNGQNFYNWNGRI